MKRFIIIIFISLLFSFSYSAMNMDIGAGGGWSGIGPKIILDLGLKNPINATPLSWGINIGANYGFMQYAASNGNVLSYNLPGAGIGLNLTYSINNDIGVSLGAMGFLNYLSSMQVMSSSTNINQFMFCPQLYLSAEFFKLINVKGGIDFYSPDNIQYGIYASIGYSFLFNDQKDNRLTDVKVVKNEKNNVPVIIITKPVSIKGIVNELPRSKLRGIKTQKRIPLIGIVASYGEFTH